MALYAFDGTWNKDEPDPLEDTNVIKFVEAYQKGAKSHKGTEYVEGVGTRFSVLGKIFGGIAGAGGRQRIEEMYEELEENYQDGDKNIDIIGFSRGAALAVHFANVIRTKGIKTRQGKTLRPRIRFLGVWDVVGSFGMPINFILPFQDWDIGYDLRVPDIVDNCFHAMALNERRQTFDLTRLNIGNARPNIEEVWFRGVHSDVGGGNRNTGLSSITLQWMLRNAKKSGLPIRQADITALDKKQDVSSPLGENIDFVINPPRQTFDTDHRDDSLDQIILEPGAQKTFRVQSRPKYSWSGIHLVKGGKYRFIIPPNQKWIDRKTKCGPEGWQTRDLKLVKRVGIRLAEKRRRHRHANWFEIIGALGRSDEHLIRIVRESNKQNPFVSPLDADLYAFANDVRLMYYNNKGSMRVIVRREA